MSRTRTDLVGAILAFCLVLSGAAHAADCTLKREESLTLTALPDGRLTVPITMSGRDYRIVLALSAPYTVVSQALVDALHLAGKPMSQKINVVVNGERIAARATLPDIRIGNIHGSGLGEVLVMREAPAPGTIGYLGLDLLSGFDVDLDSKAGKLNLFSPDHCPGKVVYWARTYTEIPFHPQRAGYPFFLAAVNGMPVVASLSTTRPTAFMDLKDAREIFGWAPDDPGLVRDSASAGEQVFHYPFKTLSFGGITVRNPNIALLSRTTPCSDQLQAKIAPDGAGDRCVGQTQLFLGLKEIGALHLYLAFKEQKLYVTAADASLDAAQGGAGP